MEEKIRRQLKSRGDLGEREMKQFTNASRNGLWAYQTARDNLKRAKEIRFNHKQKVYYLCKEE